MARIRTIKPSFWKHEELSELPEATHMLAAALLNYADDYGYFNANPKLIKAECSPLREPSVPVPESLQSLSGIGWLQLGTGSDGKRYGRIVKFDEHQKVSHKADPKISIIPITWDDSGEDPEKLQSPPESLRPEGNKEGNKEKEGNSRSADAALKADFEIFYRAFPKHVDPDDGLKAYRRARKTTGAETLLRAAERYRDDPKRDKDFTKAPASWLNKGSWKNEPDVPRETSAPDPDRAFRDMASMVAKGIRSQKTIITNMDLGRMVAEQLVTEEQAMAYGWAKPGTQMANPVDVRTVLQRAG